MNLTEPILRYARLAPKQPALVDGERVITYGELAGLVLRTAGHLQALGVKPGDQVGICLRDNWHHIIAFLAVARLGAVAVQIDWRSRPEERLRVATAFALSLTLIERGEELGPRVRSVPIDDEWHRAVAAMPYLADLPGDWSSPLAALASSGTTGIPKFTLGTHLQFYLHCAAYLEIVPSTRQQRFLLTLPLYFSAGRMTCLAHLLRGDTVILGPAFFTAAEYLDLAARYEVTVGFIVPSLVRELMAIQQTRKPLFPNIDVLISGGAPLFADEKREALQLTPKFHEIYGTAATGPIASLRPEDMAGRPTSIGKPFAVVDIDVVDDDDRPLGADQAGRLRCRGPGLTYPIAGLEGSKQGFHDGWHYTGEIAALDSHGYIHLQGRTSEVIFRGGAKIFPTEVEAVLLNHEAVAEAAVIGRPTSNTEQELIAYVIARRATTPGELVGHCRAQLSPYKVPRNIYIVAELPRTSSGKINKRALSTNPE
jgi:acyl-coenzyme A synthetase/AMP-(fatty) acid ligase